jgi:hypothetical protein
MNRLGVSTRPEKKRFPLAGASPIIFAERMAPCINF